MRAIAHTQLSLSYAADDDDVDDGDDDDQLVARKAYETILQVARKVHRVEMYGENEE